MVEQPVERLRLADLGADLDVDPAGLVGVADACHLLAGLHGDPLVLGRDVVVVGIELLGGGDGTQRQVEPDGLLRLRTEALDERVGVLAGGGQELLDVDAAGGELAGRALDPAAQIGVDQGGRGFDVGELDELGRGPADQLAPRAVQLGSARRLRMLSVHSATVSNSPMLSATHSSVELRSAPAPGPATP